MKTFHQYITELASPRKSLWIFDFDDTLAVDKSTVDVLDKKTGEIVHRLSSEKFKTYKLKDNEMFDFEGHSKKEMNADPIPATLKIMRKVMGRGGRTVILTGRTHGEGVEKYLRSMGIDIEVVAIGRKAKGSHEGIARAKRDWIAGEIDKGFNDIEVFDDNALNIEYIKTLADPGNVRVKTRLIKYSPRYRDKNENL
jgi:hydroxymethylpyrimidine pyrophosphatase-like HAD family hydrolase